MHSTKLRKHISFQELILLFFAILLFAIAGSIHQKNLKTIINLTKQDTALNVNKNILLFLNIGNKRLLADLLWIQTLLESDEAHYSQKDLNSWMYLRFLNISVLDPYFYENYLYGGLYLSVVKDDVLGAAVIFDDGLKYYPDDYRLNYYAGFNYYFEIGDFEKGLVLLEKIQNNPSAPKFIKTIVQKLKFETTKDYDVALEFLKNNYNEAKDPAIKKKILADLYALQVEIDLKCLNEGEKGCNTKDQEGNKYNLKDGKWVAPRSFESYRIKRRK